MVVMMTFDQFVAKKKAYLQDSLKKLDALVIDHSDSSPDETPDCETFKEWDDYFSEWAE